MSFDWRALVRSVAPMLGTALGGPLGGVAGAALAKALGAKDSSDKSLEAAMCGASPDQLLRIQEAEQTFTVQMTQLGFENVQALERIAAEDRASARDRETKTSDWTPRLLAMGITVGFFGILGYMMKWPIPDGTRDILNVMLGALGTAWISVVTYYFGSSAGSARKDELLRGEVKRG